MFIMLKAIVSPQERSVMQGVRDHLRAMPPGTIFTPAELLLNGVGSSDAIRQALTRLVRAKEIRRVRKGYYERPHRRVRSRNPVPSDEAFARAFAHKVAARRLRETHTHVDDEEPVYA